MQEAKRQVAARSASRASPGPSEVMIIADDRADPRAVALDLLAQAEHGADSPPVLASDDPAVIAAVEAERRRRRPPWTADHAGRVCQHAPGGRAGRGVRAGAPGVITRDRVDASPRHAAGAVFVGRNGATAFGDYVAGSNHVLPTGGAASLRRPSGPTTFLRDAVVDMTDGAVETLTPHLAALADAEGFPMHRRSAEARRRP